MAAGIVTAQALPAVPQMIPALAIVPPEGFVIVSVKGGPLVPVPVPDPLPVEVPPDPEEPVEPEDDDAVNAAAQLRGPSSASATLAPTPAQLPDQPEKTWPASGVAIRPTVIGPGMVTAQAVAFVPQLMPALLTVPPVGRVTVSVNGGPFVVVPVVVPLEVPPEPVDDDPPEPVGVFAVNVAAHVRAPSSASA
jgi:hypothetical protein